MKESFCIIISTDSVVPVRRYLLTCKRFLAFSAAFIVFLPNTSAAINQPAINGTCETQVIHIHGVHHESQAKDFISDLTSKGIGVIKDADISEEQRQKEFRTLLQKHFDMKTIGRFALGRYWKTSTAAQQSEYLDLFEDMVVRVYSRRFSEYNGEVINIVSARAEGKADALVSSMIVPPNGSKVSVDWRVRKKKNGQLKIIDIIVEGVSMSLTQRSDFASVIQRGGGKIDVLLEHLRKN